MYIKEARVFSASERPTFTLTIYRQDTRMAIIIGARTMLNDKNFGILLTAVSVIVIVFYAIVLFSPQLVGLGPEVSQLLIKLTVFVAVAGVMGILAWIGYTLATTPPPKPVEEIEKEIEEELKKLEKEVSQKEEKK